MAQNNQQPMNPLTDQQVAQNQQYIQGQPVAAGQGYDQNQYNNYMQQFNRQNSLSEQQINEQKNTLNQIQYKKAQVQQPSCQFPQKGLDSCLGITQLVIFIAIIANMFTSPSGVGGFFILHIIIAAVKCCVSEPRKLLQNTKTKKQIDDYCQTMKKNAPTCQYTVESYHYETRRSGSGRNRSTRRVKVVSHTDTQNLIYTRCSDNTDSLDEIFKSNNFLRIKSILYMYKGNQLALNNWNLLTQAMNIKGSRLDSQYEGKDTSFIAGKMDDTLAFNSEGLPCSLQSCTMYLCYILGLGLLYDSNFYSKTALCTFNIEKTIFCDIFVQNQLQVIMQPQQMMGQQGLIVQNNGMLMQQQQQPVQMVAQQQQPLQMMPQQQQVIQMAPLQQQQQQIQMVPPQQQQVIQQPMQQNTYLQPAVGSQQQYSNQQSPMLSPGPNLIPNQQPQQIQQQQQYGNIQQQQQQQQPFIANQQQQQNIQLQNQGNANYNYPQEGMNDIQIQQQQDQKEKVKL